MAQITTYICDRCGKQSTDKNVLNIKTVGIFVGEYSVYYSAGHKEKEEIRKEWCKCCRQTLGIYEGSSKFEPDVVPVATTLEDLVREIVGDMVEDAINNRR